MLTNSLKIKMGKEINLMAKYPKTKRDTKHRVLNKTEEDINLARKFGKEFFDGDRSHGYGGFNYNPKYWSEVVKDFTNYYDLNSNSRILDVGCAKGFLVYDLTNYLKSQNIYGIDISSYAIENCKSEIKKNVFTGQAHKINFPDKFFDLVISITTLHNYEIDGVKDCLKEINRISKKAFITVDAYSNDEEKEAMYNWNLTAKTILHKDEWKQIFQECNFIGDYYWFMP